MCALCALEKLKIIDLKVIEYKHLCDNKNVKFHCFNPGKKQPQGMSPGIGPKHYVILVNIQASVSSQWWGQKCFRQKDRLNL